MRIVLIVAAVIIVVILVVLIGGALLPATHLAMTRATINGRPEDVWRVVTDVRAYPTWRSDVKTVEVIDAKHWREDGKNGRIAYEVQDARPPERWVTRISDDKLPFGGTWTYELRPVDGRTQLTIREDGIVRNPAFRFMARYVFGYYGTQEAYLKALGRTFKQEVTPERVL